MTSYKTDQRKKRTIVRFVNAQPTYYKLIKKPTNHKKMKRSIKELKFIYTLQKRVTNIKVLKNENGLEEGR